MPRRAVTKSNRPLKIALWTVGSLALLFVVGLLVVQTMLNRYLRSPEFRAKLEERSAHNFRAEVKIDPVRFEGSEFFVDSVNARGTPEAGFSQVELESLHGDVSMPSVVRLLFGDRRFKITSAEVELLRVKFFENEKIKLDLPPREERVRTADLEKLFIRELQVQWPDSGLTGTRLTAVPVEGGWKLSAEGGKLTQLVLGRSLGLELVNAEVVVKEPSAFVEQAKFRHPAGGEIAVSGEVNWKEQADLRFNFKEIKVEPLLPEDWRARLHGELAGELHFEAPMGKVTGKPTVSGKLQLNRGVLEGLPVMNKIADYLKTEQFRRAELQIARCNLRSDEKGLRVDELVIESKQLFVIRGGFTYANKLVDGTFDVGIAPSRLQYLPGSETRVFVAQNDGYAWAKMHVTGPPDKLKEDLSGRLVNAAVGAAAEKVEKVATDTVDAVGNTVKKVGEGVLNKVFGP